MRGSLFLLAVLVISLFTPTSVFAQVNNLGASDSAVIRELEGIKLSPGVLEIGSSRVSPASPLFFLKTVRESLERSLALTPQVKRIRSLEFAGRRLRELNSLVATPDEPLIESTLVHYRDLVNELDSLTQGQPSLQIWVAEGLGEHLDILLNVYHKVRDSNAQRAVRATIEFVEQHNRNLAQRLRDPVLKQELINRIALTQATVCNFYAKELANPELNDVDRYVLNSHLQKCTESIQNELKERLEQIKQEQNRQKTLNKPSKISSWIV